MVIGARFVPVRVADILPSSICALTLYRIKVTSSVNPQNWQARSAQISFLTCLEALLGIINACLPTLKPIYNKIGSIGFIGYFSAWTSRDRDSIPSFLGVRKSARSSLARKKNWPYISSPRPISLRSSELVFSYELGAAGRSSPGYGLPKIPVKSFSYEVEKEIYPHRKYRNGYG